MNGEICVVTGATSGIGRATAIGLAKKGARVVLVARNQAKATQLVDEISKIRGVIKPEIVLADLSEMKQVCRASDEIRNRAGPGLSGEGAALTPCSHRPIFKYASQDLLAPHRLPGNEPEPVLVNACQRVATLESD
jgi:NAD(P)-dependent dehydrogenase (short-subunit alcohol dehydrogenase family)